MNELKIQKKSNLSYSRTDITYKQRISEQAVFALKIPIYQVN